MMTFTFYRLSGFVAFAQSVPMERGYRLFIFYQQGVPMEHCLQRHLM